MTTSPGYSSRSSLATYKQLPQRDEAIVSELTPGFSNSAPNEGVASATVKAPAKAAAQTKVVEDDKVEDKAVKKAASSTKKKS